MNQTHKIILILSTLLTIDFTCSMLFPFTTMYSLLIDSYYLHKAYLLCMFLCAIYNLLLLKKE